VEESVRIYEVIGWIDVYIDHERLLLAALQALNLAERNSFSVGIAMGFFAMGTICDFMGISRLAGYYHRHAMALAERVQHPSALGHAHVGLAVHEQSLGRSETVDGHYRRAAEAYWEAGDMRGWGVSIAMLCRLLCLHVGDFTHSLQQAQELVRVGQDGADAQVLGWGLHGQGLVQWRTGLLDEAVNYIQRAVELYRAIPNYLAVAFGSSELGQCYLCQGKLQQALAVLEESNQLIADQGLTGIMLTSPRNGLLAAYLLAAEHAEESERADWLNKAKQACKTALKQGKINRSGLPHAMRLQGTYKWLRGKPAAARKWWQRSLALAEEMGQRYDLGMTYLEMGQRLKEQAHLKRAEAILAEIGAEWDLARAREALERETG
jgi:tetratricopeptide (TPR) repeat protein